MAYVAGVIDARGHLEANKRHGVAQPRIRVTTKRVALLNYLARVTGTKVVRDDRGYERRGCSEHCTDAHVHIVRQSAQWTVDSSRATIVLFNIQPYVVANKTEVGALLRIGLQSYPAARGNTADRMAALGWLLP